ncbi:hypothetical protein ACFY93_09535 [Streptomyces sp. NPDC008313]|uniref:hypothetical protein n=1 Tax=Streptomyces sp. NPDC008313 TaxID=3364826 RepID=UPI0036E3066B
MSHRIARFLEPVLRLLMPGTGRRRRGRGPERPAAAPAACLSSAPLCPACRDRFARLGPLRGEDHARVRPYLVAHEQRAAHDRRREEERRQRARRRALWLAVRGVDIGPRVIHGVEVTA